MISALGYADQRDVDGDRRGQHLADALDRRVDAQQVVVDVAEVLLRADAHRRHAAALQLAHVVEQRQHRVLQRHQPALEGVQVLDLAARRRAAEELLLRRLERGLEVSQHGEIAIDDRVHQRVEDEARAVAQQLRLALAALRAPRRNPGACGAAPRGRNCGRRTCRPRRSRGRRCRPRWRRWCAARRTASRRTPRSSVAGGPCAHPRPPAGAARTPPPSRPAPRATDRAGATQTKHSARPTCSLMSCVRDVGEPLAVFVQYAVDEHAALRASRARIIATVARRRHPCGQPRVGDGGVAPVGRRRPAMLYFFALRLPGAALGFPAPAGPPTPPANLLVDPRSSAAGPGRTAAAAPGPQRTRRCCWCWRRCSSRTSSTS